MTAAETYAGEARPKTPVHLWIVGVLALLWNAMGAFDYLATQLELEFYMSQFTPEQLAYFYGFPAWAVAGWAFGVWGAFAGSLGLLLRKKWSVWAFAASLAGMLVSSIYTLGLTDGAQIMGTTGMIFTGVIWVVAILLLVYARAQANRGVLR
ncbi:MAG TPA: hypothetical protein VLT32_11470 [Candidatus Sulfomarinibacteraceae bacterium]|nr:hypothetical protein [Candidatus Sulfomarinibacteraceae bacterium]